MACGVAVMLLGTVSCNKSGNSSATPEEKAFGDTLSVAMGESSGYGLLSQYLTLPESEQKKFDKDEILRGLKQILMTDTTDQAYLTGVGIGLQMAATIDRYEQTGIPMDRKKIYEAYAKAFSSDTLDGGAANQAQMNFQMYAMKAQQKMQEFYEAQQEAARKEKENSPEAKENVAKGKAYLKEQMAKDKDIHLTPSGVAIKVVKEGTGETVGENGVANVKYVGRLIDGTVFDQNENGLQMTPHQLIPGFAEVLAMMKEGSSYVIYIPGNLAYGVDGSPQAGIGPNAMLVFDVETSEVKHMD